MSRKFAPLLRALPVLAVSLITLAGCGSGEEPLNLLGDAESLPELELPLSSDALTNSNTRITPYRPNVADVNQRTSGFEFANLYLFTNVSTQQNVYSPADGVVADITTSVEGALTLQTVTLVHSSRLTTQLTRLSTTKRVGDRVTKGEVLGTVSQNTNGVITLIAVRVDGNLKCPLSYFSQTAQQIINARFGTYFTAYSNQSPCQP